MAFIIPIILIITGILRPKSVLATILFVAYFIVIMGLNIKTPDYDTYEKVYDPLYITLVEDNYEIGFKGLVLLCNYFGLSYQEFRVVVSILFSVCVVFASRKLSLYPNYLLTLLLIWPFLPGVSGLRQTLANAVMLCGIPHLAYDDKKHLIKYVIWILLAWSIHQSALFYLLFILGKREFGNKEVRYIVYATVGGICILGFSQFLGNISFIQNNHKLDKWLNIAADQGADHQNFAGFAIRTFLVIINAYGVTKLYNIIVSKSHIETFQIRLLRICRNVSLLICLTIPGYIISGEYQRLLYGAMFLYSVVFASFHYMINEKRYQMYKLIPFFLFLLTAWYYTFSMTSHDVLATLTDNLLFK